MRHKITINYQSLEALISGKKIVFQIRGGDWVSGSVLAVVWLSRTQILTCNYNHFAMKVLGTRPVV